MSVINGVYAQNHEGTWELIGANVNRISNGTSETIHKLTTAEIEKKAIPATLEFEKNTVTITKHRKKSQSRYTPQQGRSAQALSDDDSQKKYTFWLADKDTLVLTSEYDEEDFQGNELRLTYKRK